jgi:hypothetical protein
MAVRPPDPTSGRGALDQALFFPQICRDRRSLCTPASAWRPGFTIVCCVRPISFSWEVKAFQHIECCFEALFFIEGATFFAGS